MASQDGDHTNAKVAPFPAPARFARQQAARPLVSRRAALRGIGAACLSLASSGCGSQPSTPSRIGGTKAQLVYQDWRTEAFPPMAREMLNRFEESHPNIRVYYASDPVDVETQMLADMEAGTAPDVFQGCCTHFPTWAQRGHCLDLGPYVWDDIDQATIDDWDQAQYQALSTADGLRFGLPKYHGALALYYNMDVLDSVGAPYPSADWTHEDYLATMRRVAQGAHRDTDRAWGSMFDVSWDRVQVHVNAWGGHFVDPDDASLCTMCAPEAIAAMEWLRARIWDDRCMASSVDVDNLSPATAFAAGKLAMVEDGSWSLRDILGAANFRVGVAPMPAGPVRRATLATSDGFGIYSGTKHPDAAWELLKFLVSKDYGRAMARAAFLQPARRSLVEEWVGIVRTEYPDATREMDLQAFADGQERGYSVTAEVFSSMSGVREWTGTAWQRIFTLGTAPVSDMHAVCERITESQRGVA